MNKAQKTMELISSRSNCIYSKCSHIVDEVSSVMVQRLEYTCTFRESFFNAAIIRDNLVGVTVEDIIHCIQQEGFSVKQIGFEYEISIPLHTKR